MTNDLSHEILARLTTLLGTQPASWKRVAGGGYTPAARWQVNCGDYSVFVKVATTPLTAMLLRREQVAYSSITGAFIPKLIGWDDHETKPILVIEDLSQALWPPPWTPRLLDRALQSLALIHQTQAEVPPFEAVHSHHTLGWHIVSENPLPFLALEMASGAWLKGALPVLLEAEAACGTTGDTLAHFDIRSDNMCFTGDRALFVDWAEACLANPKLDTGFWLPSLAFEGGPQPESILPNEPEIAAWVAGFFAARAGLATIPDAPQVRRVQREQLSTALPWAQRALGLSQDVTE